MAVIVSDDLGNAIAGGVGTRVSATKGAQDGIGTSLTAVTWDTEVFDTDGWFTAGGSIFTVPAGQGGLYAIDAFLRWDTPSTTKGEMIVLQRDPLGIGAFAEIARNGVAVVAALTAGDLAPGTHVSVTLELAATDIIRAMAAVTSTTDDIDAGSITIVKIGPTV